MSLKTVWFITGASSGFGLELSLHAIRSGHTVYCTVRNRERAILAVSKIEAGGGNCLVLDVNDLESIPSVIESVLTKEGKIDILVNNAGFGLRGAVADVAIEAARLQMETNFFAPLKLIQSVVPSMRQRKSGSIVNISSIAGIHSTPEWGLYSASKFALEGLSESLQQELSEFNISVLIVEPGGFITNFHNSIVEANSQKGVYKDIPVQHMLERLKGRAVGDVRKAAKVIFDTVAGSQTDRLIGKLLRLPLGSDVNGKIEQKLECLKADHEKTRELAKTTDIDDMLEFSDYFKNNTTSSVEA